MQRASTLSKLGLRVDRQLRLPQMKECESAREKKIATDRRGRKGLGI